MDGDEGRSRLRKATVSCQRAINRGYPNGATRRDELPSPEREQTRGSETSQYPEEEKIKNDSVSSGERKRKSLNQWLRPLG